MAVKPTTSEPRPWLSLLALGGVVLLFALAVFFYRSALLAATQRERAEMWQRHNVEVIDRTHLLLSGLTDQETGQRGYLLTSEPRFLEAYTRGRADTKRSLPELVRLTKNNPVQQRNLVEMADLIDTKQYGMARSIELARRGNLAAALAMVRSGDGKDAMDAIRRKITIILAEEQRISVTSDAAAIASIKAVRDYLNLFALFGLLLLTVTLIAVIWILRGSRKAWLAANVADYQQRVEADRDFLHSIVDTSNDPIYVKDLKGRYVLVNRSTAQFFGAVRSEVTGKTDHDFLATETVATLTEADKAVIADGTPLVIEEAFSVDGVTRTYLSSKTPWYVDGAIAGIIGVSHDITDRTAAESALKELNDNLETLVLERTRAFEASQHQILQMQKLEALGQLTSGVAHDFNNILAAIASGFSLIEKKVDDDYVRMITEHCRAATFRGAKIVKQMLAFARQEVLAPVPIDLPVLIKEIEPLIRQAIPGNIIIFEFQDDLPHVIIDPALLEAALLNLAGNANDAMVGGGTLSISVARNEEVQGDWPVELEGKEAVILTVRDTGTGMTPDILQRIVEPFFTTKPVGKGTGLGLAMVQGFITQSGGALRIQSEIGQGTTVKLYLPQAIGDENEVPVDWGANQTALRGTGSVLLIDDDPDLRPLVALQLQSLGYQVTQAESCETALAYLDAGTEFDVVLCDVTMEGGDGIVFAQGARQRRPQLPILFMTGRTEATRTIGEIVIHKPFTLEGLAIAIADSLDDARHQIEPENAPQKKAAALGESGGH